MPNRIKTMSRGMNNFKREGALPPLCEPQHMQRKSQKQKRKERLKKRAEARAVAYPKAPKKIPSHQLVKAKIADRKVKAELRAYAESRQIEGGPEGEDGAISSPDSNFFERASDGAVEAASYEDLGVFAVEQEADGDAPLALPSQQWDKAERAGTTGPDDHTRYQPSGNERALDYGSPVLTESQRLQEPKRHQGQSLEQALTVSIKHFTQGIERLGSFLPEAAKSPEHMAESYRAFVLQHGADSFVVGEKEVSRDEVVREIEALIGRLAGS